MFDILIRVYREVDAMTINYNLIALIDDNLISRIVVCQRSIVYRSPKPVSCQILAGTNSYNQLTSYAVGLKNFKKELNFGFLKGKSSVPSNPKKTGALERNEVS